MTVINGEECTSQHKLLVGDIVLSATKVNLKNFPLRRRIWKLKEPAISEAFRQSDRLQNTNMSDDIDESWQNLHP